ncbi:MAG: FtsW/RodA/SpoVE family cell cycle protein [Methylobacter sp.]|nr:FtsW/RodA/SpoVE family cell cycle protein [Methylobacter sp.]
MTAITQLKRQHWEILLTLIVVLWLIWQGRVFSETDLFRGADNRYLRDMALNVELLPETEQSGIRLHGIEAKLAELSGNDDKQAAEAELSAWLAEQLQALMVIHDAWSRSFFIPLEAAMQQREQWEMRAREGFVGEDEQETYRQLMMKTEAYRHVYQLRVERGAAYSRPVECAWEYLWQRVSGKSPMADDFAAVKALAGLAALLEGKRVGKLELPGLGSQAGAWEPGVLEEPGVLGKPRASGEQKLKDCRGFSSPLDAVQSGARLIAKARSAAAKAAKASALPALLPTARWQFAAWALGGLLLVSLGRKQVRLNRMLCLSLMVWAVLAALTRPQLQWLGGGEWGLLMSGLMPVVYLSAAALLALCLPFKQVAPLAFPASALGYPGFVLFTGLSWWLMLDLGANGYVDNRFLGLYQQGHLFIAFMLVSIVPVLRAYLAGFGLRVLSFLPLAAMRRTALMWLLILFVVIGFLSIMPKGHRQFTSELIRFFLIAGASWFLMVRAQSLLSPWLRPPADYASGWKAWLSWQQRVLPVRLKLAAPLLVLLVFVLGGFYRTDDNGPLLVILFAAAIFVGLGVASLASNQCHWRLGLALGIAAVPAYVWAGSFALLNYGHLFGSRIGERLANAQNPFLAGNDQMALVLWFQAFAIENGGFGFGHTPWCGDLASSSCGGVPPQIQSDYIYTALVGVYGLWGSSLLLLLAVLWLWRLVRCHPGVTSGLADSDDPGQAWLSWLALCWAGLSLTQLAVTVAGNLAWLPLTGITFPFLSFGFWSLLNNTFFLALALNLNRRTS